MKNEKGMFVIAGNSIAELEKELETVKKLADMGVQMATGDSTSKVEKSVCGSCGNSCGSCKIPKQSMLDKIKIVNDYYDDNDTCSDEFILEIVDEIRKFLDEAEETANFNIESAEDCPEEDDDDEEEDEMVEEPVGAMLRKLIEKYK